LSLVWRDIAVLVNNAGHDGGGRECFDDCETDALVSIVETNITEMIRVSKAIIPGMLARGGGMSSMSARPPAILRWLMTLPM
jgi:3-hydroxy acid dehydrogenase/malonic semialdehyde reductase